MAEVGIKERLPFLRIGRIGRRILDHDGIILRRLLILVKLDLLLLQMTIDPHQAAYDEEQGSKIYQAQRPKLGAVAVVLHHEDQILFAVGRRRRGDPMGHVGEIVQDARRTRHESLLGAHCRSPEGKHYVDTLLPGAVLIPRKIHHVGYVDEAGDEGQYCDGAQRREVQADSEAEISHLVHGRAERRVKFGGILIFSRFCQVHYHFLFRSGMVEIAEFSQWIGCIAMIGIAGNILFGCISLLMLLLLSLFPVLLERPDGEQVISLFHSDASCTATAASPIIIIIPTRR
mmetsp:Transcript_27370/g.65783  ORF Transcript_27370/g.65783 Transcript_27370/m.65783 type:complete len:288 (+) Transcript_27370:3202-4065(+)